jgi:predicted metalloendopeptidase
MCVYYNYTVSRNITDMGGLNKGTTAYTINCSGKASF